MRVVVANTQGVVRGLEDSEDQQLAKKRKKCTTMDLVVESDFEMEIAPKIELNESKEMDPKDRLLGILDRIEAHVEELRRESLVLEERKDALFTSLDTIRNSEYINALTEMDKDDIQRYIERVTSRCMTVEITVRTDRDKQQEDALYQVNRLIDHLVVSFQSDPITGMTKCQSFLAACKDESEVLLAFNVKRIPFKTHFVNIANGEQYQQWYLDVNPRGEVPAIKDGNKYLADSMKIINYIEEKYSNDAENHPRLVPTVVEPELLDKHNRLHSAIHDLPADVITYGSFYHTEVVGRQKMPFIYPVRRHMKAITEKAPPKVRALAEKSPEPLKTVLAKKSEDIESLLKTAKTKESFLQCLEKVDDVLCDVEDQLRSNRDFPERWLFNESFTLADVSLTTLLERLNVLGLEGRFWANGKRPYILSYYDRVRKTEQYKKSMPTLAFHVKSLVKGITYMTL